MATGSEQKCSKVPEIRARPSAVPSIAMIWPGPSLQRTQRGPLSDSLHDHAPGPPTHPEPSSAS
eukprot:scaffold55987_cov72-Phaeocystis_antarctica.AAC.7